VIVDCRSPPDLRTPDQLRLPTGRGLAATHAPPSTAATASQTNAAAYTASPTPSPSATSSASPTPAPSRTGTPTLVPLKVTFFDVGHGDSAWVHCGEFDALIDGGRATAVPGVINYLRRENVSSLDVVVASHPHADHIRGLTDVLAAFTVEKVIHKGSRYYR